MWGLDENAIGDRIVASAIKVHRTLGPGLLENVYEACLGHELWKIGLAVARQPVLPVVYDGLELEIGYRLDLLVERKVVIEIKAIETLTPLHRAQLLSYLKLGGFKIGYLLNFHTHLMKDGIMRLANKL
jgi:GxxExxY protein